MSAPRRGQQPTQPLRLTYAQSQAVPPDEARRRVRQAVRLLLGLDTLPGSRR